MILVTGASRGIGLELACQYAEAGNTVLATCREPETANALAHLAESHPNVEVQPLDVVDPLSVLSLASLVRKRGENLDVLINNAGILVQEKFGEWTADAFSATMETNVVGPALVMQAFAELVNEGGKIINVSSAMGSFGINMEAGGLTSSYATSKAALNMLVRQVAPGLLAKGVITVSFSPGWVKTEMGGPEANLSVRESVESLIRAFGNLGPEQAGQFLDYTGLPLPW
ncbi:SDR family oxidoreductase [Pelagicoccus albus]